MFNKYENERLLNVRYGASLAAATAAQNKPDDDGIDLWTSAGYRPDKVALLISVSDVGTGGVLDLIVQDSVDQSTWDADFATIEQIDTAGVYMVIIKNPKRYIRVNEDATTDAVVFGVMILTTDEKRRKVADDANMLTVTYAANRASEPQT
jgi:hypothetical protein